MAGDCIRLTAVERVKIELGLRDGQSLTAIAAELGRPKGTMSKGDRPQRRTRHLRCRRGSYSDGECAGLLANVKPGAHVAAPGFIVESSLEDSKVLVAAMGAQGFSRQH
jgi:hypothetical protein